MRVLTQTELNRLPRPALMALLREIAATLPHLPEGSHELRIAHENLRSIRAAMAQQMPRPR